MSFIKSLKELQTQLNNLEQAYLQSQRNQVPITAKTDETANGLVIADNNIEKNTADIDYLAMMADIEIPTEEDESIIENEVEASDDAEN